MGDCLNVVFFLIFLEIFREGHGCGELISFGEERVAIVRYTCLYIFIYIFKLMIYIIYIYTYTVSKQMFHYLFLCIPGTMKPSCFESRSIFFPTLVGAPEKPIFMSPIFMSPG